MQTASQILEFEDDTDLTFTPPDFGVTILGCVNDYIYVSHTDSIQKGQRVVISSGCMGEG